MSPRLDDLALVKRLLVAQSAVQRARLRAEAAALRSNAMTRIPLFALVMGLAGASRAARWIGAAGSLFALVRTVRSAIRLLRK